MSNVFEYLKYSFNCTTHTRFGLIVTASFFWDNQYQNVTILEFVAARHDGGVGDNRTLRCVKFQLKLSPPT